MHASEHSRIKHRAKMINHRRPLVVRIHIQGRVGLLAISLIKRSRARVESRSPVLAVVSVTNVRFKLHLLRRGFTIVDLLHNLLELVEVANR